MPAARRPKLRPVETIVVADEVHGKLLLLRDTQGIAQGVARIPPSLIPLLARFDGESTLDEIARSASGELEEPVARSIAERLADDLEHALFLEGARFEAERSRTHARFVAAKERPAAHAGGAYLDDPAQLQAYIEDECLATAPPPRPGGSPILALVAPHIDPWRGARNYGRAYRELGARLPPGADTFLVFGTSHAPMNEPFAFCKKDFATPLGAMPVDVEALQALERGLPFDPYADQMNHLREHSIEFQTIFLRQMLGDARPATIVPILAGMGDEQVNGVDPAAVPGIERFFENLARLLDDRRGRVVVVAGADLAHVGPRFGDPGALGEAARRHLEATDRVSLDLAASVEAAGFFAHVSGDLATRRVCGLGPIYALLRSLPPGARGDLLAYEQTVDPEEGSVVSHASIAFTRD